MKEYKVTIRCDHVETRTITAKSQKDAIRLIEAGEYDDILNWWCEGQTTAEEIEAV